MGQSLIFAKQGARYGDAASQDGQADYSEESAQGGEDHSVFGGEREPCDVSCQGHCFFLAVHFAAGLLPNRLVARKTEFPQKRKFNFFLI